MKLIHFADLHLGVESYGRINPQTGLSTRLEDFLKALDQLVDYALGNEVDLVVFCGDAYKSREPTQTQQREFAKRINRLASNGVPVFLLTGNHDLPNAFGRATSTEIFDALSIRNVYVASKPEIYRIPTKHGEIQVAALPWLRRSRLLTEEESKNLNFQQLNQRLQEVLTRVVTENAAKLDPTLPAILAAHVWVQGAAVGSEKAMTIGQEHVLLLSNIANPTLDYVALGHIHKHQVLHEAPPVAYSGSLERLDFSDEENDKGFYVVDIETGQSGKRRTTYQFHPVAARRFLTINVDIPPDDASPTATVLKAIAEQGDKIKEAIVRLELSLPAELEAQLKDSELKSTLKDAHYFSIAKDIRRESRLRLGQWSGEEITPLSALAKWLETQKLSPERAKALLEYGEKLVREQKD